MAVCPVSSTRELSDLTDQSFRLGKDLGGDTPSPPPQRKASLTYVLKHPKDLQLAFRKIAVLCMYTYVHLCLYVGV